MICKPKCGSKFKLLNAGSSLAVAPHVRSLTISGGSLKVHNSDGTDYELSLPVTAGHSGRSIQITNATGKTILANVLESSS